MNSRGQDEATFESNLVMVVLIIILIIIGLLIVRALAGRAGI